MTLAQLCTCVEYDLFRRRCVWLLKIKSRFMAVDLRAKDPCNIIHILYRLLCIFCLCSKSKRFLFYPVQANEASQPENHDKMPAYCLCIIWIGWKERGPCDKILMPLVVQQVLLTILNDKSIKRLLWVFEQFSGKRICITISAFGAEWNPNMQFTEITFEATKKANTQMQIKQMSKSRRFRGFSVKLTM